MGPITCIRLSAGGGSCLEDLEIELTESGELGRMSEPLAATGVVFRENDPGYDLDWHCAPDGSSSSSSTGRSRSR